jgi:subtilisin family serine protease
MLFNSITRLSEKTCWICPTLLILLLAFLNSGQEVFSADKPAFSPENKTAYYIYHGEEFYLELKRSQLAVYLKSSSKPEAFKPSAASLGVDFISATSTEVGGGYLLDLVTPLIDISDAQDRIKKLLSNPEVEFASPVFDGANNNWITMTQDILIRFKPEYRAQAEVLLQELAPELEVVQNNFGDLSGAYQLRSSSLSGFEVLASANRLAGEPSVEWAEPDALFSGRGALIPNDPLFPDIWGFRNTGQFGGTPGMDMGADSAWDVTLGCEGIKVLILDTGVEQDHPDINQLPGAGPVNQCDNHGTAVAGCVSGIINNALGAVGIAPGCVIISVKPFSSNIPCDGGWSGTASGTVNALTSGESQGVRVTNNSNYYGFTSSSIEAKYASMYANGIVHFASAGNFASPNITYPASIPEVNAIAALEMDGTLASFSNWGIGLDFSAPGVLMYSTDRTGSDGYDPGDYTFFSGTSAASPYSAGVAALILSQDPVLTVPQVEAVMQAAARDLGTFGYDTTYGWGFVNANNSVLAVTPLDSDTDAVADPCDICPTVFNPLQEHAKPGDANASNTYSLSDVIAIVNYIFSKPGFPSCPSNTSLCWLSDLLCRGDWDGSATAALSDVIRAVNHIFNKPNGPWNPLASGLCCIPYNQ